MRERYETKDQTQQQSRRDSDSKTQMAICSSCPTPSLAFQAPPGDPSPQRSLALLPGTFKDFRRVCPPSKNLMSDHPTTALMQNPHLFVELFGLAILLELTFEKAPLLGRKLAVQKPANQYFQSVMRIVHFLVPHAH